MMMKLPRQLTEETNVEQIIELAEKMDFSKQDEII